MSIYADKMAEYVNKVGTGEFASGRLVRLAVRRHVMDLEHGESRGLRWDQDAADRACGFFPHLRHSTGDFAGKPFELRLFQVFIVSCLFGWHKWDVENAKWYRRFREALVTFGKGNGKSPLAAGIANYMTFGEGEPRAEGYCYATKRDQAKQLFDEACRQARSWPKFASKIVKYKLNLDGPNDSFFRPMGSETHDDGFVPHFMAMDEIHRWREHHRGMYDVLTASLGKRPQPMLFKISTAGNEESHILKEQLATAERILEQVENPPVDDGWFGDEEFAYVACLDKEDDIHDEANWPKANPMLLEPKGPVQLKALRSMSAKAESDLAVQLKFRRFHCNQQVSSLNKPIRAEAWAQGNIGLPENLDEYTAFGALDLARSRDFAALSLVFDLGDRYALKSWAWTVDERPETLQTAEFLRVMDQPNVIVHEGNQIEYADIRRKIVELNETYNVASWTYDPAWATETAQTLEAEHGISCVVHAQNPKTYNEPLTNFLEAVVAGEIIHGGCPLLAWTAGNLVVRSNPEGLKMPSKDKSVNKIDPIVAALMAWREMLFGEHELTPQVW